MKIISTSIIYVVITLFILYKNYFNVIYIRNNYVIYFI